MSLTAAASGLVVFLLSVSVVQGQRGWEVTYSSTEICAVKGSTVEIRCSYKYPSTWKGSVNTLEKTFWFTQQKGGDPVDLTTDSEYAGRVEDRCENNICTLRIRNLRESDSAQYWFRVITNQDVYSGLPVTLSVTDAPKLPSVSVSPSAEIEEGSSVTLTCSSDANPAANYNWYKEDKNPHPFSDNEGPRLVLSSIHSSDSGKYYCTAENLLGNTISDPFSIDVKYAPKLPSVSVSPSAEIEEGSSVTLTCSTDANPAAKYTWYKKNQTVFQGAEGSYNFTSISSEDRGIYYCKSENQYGEITSSSLCVDVQYGPKLPSVSVSPSAEIEEGSSVTLTCSSDANPAAYYTWYKKNEDSPKASGQIFNITDFRRSWKLPAAATISVVLVAVISLSVFLWIRKKRASRDSSEPEERPGNREEPLPDQGQPEQQDDLQYATVHFSNNRAEPLYSNMRAAQPLRHTEQQEATDYAAVNFKSRAPRTRPEDPAELYSVITKIH
ncbi:hypothetical protein NQZ68_013476 [Dissostichus eleginoides]|nr:hypothetical protein NQZ68_013476 [Dissostichus eleginoides]